MAFASALKLLPLHKAFVGKTFAITLLKIHKDRKAFLSCSFGRLQYSTQYVMYELYRHDTTLIILYGMNFHLTVTISN